MRLSCIIIIMPLSSALVSLLKFVARFRRFFSHIFQRNRFNAYGMFSSLSLVIIFQSKEKKRKALNLNCTTLSPHHFVNIIAKPLLINNLSTYYRL
jgi:hypothetical protein